MQQHSRWRVVNTFRGGNQLDATLPQGAHDVDVVATVSGKTVNLMDNNVVHPVGIFLHILQHFLELRAVGRLGGRASIHKLFTNHRPHGEGLFLVRLPLRRDGKAFVRATAALRLTACGYAKIGHGELWRHAGSNRLHRVFCRKTHLKSLLV